MRVELVKAQGLAQKVPAGVSVSLDDYDTMPPTSITMADALAMAEELRLELADLQNDMYGAATHSLLAVFQGIDAAGKDTAIRGVFGHHLCPLWLRAEGFKIAIFDEKGRDFLWRSHRIAPAPGYWTVLHRSYYEGVLAERVHKKVPERIWQTRYGQINSFEAVLAQANTIVLKFFLHVSKEEQRRRLVAREATLTTAWKLNPDDWKERQLWDDNRAAFDDCLSNTSTDAGSWFVVPNDQKWFGQLAILDAVVRTLRPLRDDWRRSLAELQERRIAQIDRVGRN